MNTRPVPVSTVSWNTVKAHAHAPKTPTNSVAKPWCALGLMNGGNVSTECGRAKKTVAALLKINLAVIKILNNASVEYCDRDGQSHEGFCLFACHRTYEIHIRRGGGKSF